MVEATQSSPRDNTVTLQITGHLLTKVIHFSHKITFNNEMGRPSHVKGTLEEIAVSGLLPHILLH